MSYCCLHAKGQGDALSFASSPLEGRNGALLSSGSWCLSLHGGNHTAPYLSAFWRFRSQVQWSSPNCHITPNLEPLVIVCSKATQPTSSLSHFDLRGPAVGHRLHDALMPFKCIAMTWLVNLSTCQCLCLLREASECFPSLGQNSWLCLERRMQ